ncbi:MAG: helicase C-terminal domain-containing protein, partial [Promethearchaeota archaeon]
HPTFLREMTGDPDISKKFIDWENQLNDNQYIEISMEEGLNFLKSLHSALIERETNIATVLNDNPRTINLETLRELRKITEMISALSDLIANPESSDLSFFFQQDRFTKKVMLTVQPFDIAFIFSRLFRGSKNLFLSATIGDGEYLAHLLGLNPQHCYYIHETSSFKKENHPFILLTEAERLSTATREKKEKTFRSIENQSQKFLELMQQQRLRGLILTSSFELANLMRQLAKANKLQVVTHTAGKSDTAIKDFITHRKGDVLITPSAWEGISLDDDLARLCLIPKLPFPMLKDPIILKKTKKYPQFLENDVLISIQQAHGRIQRNNSDWGISICFDGNFRWLSKKKVKSIEPWFSSRIHELSITNAKTMILEMINTHISQKPSNRLKKENSAFSRMKKSDREWLESSGLADLLKK